MSVAPLFDFVYASYLFGQLHGLDQSLEEAPNVKELLQSDPEILALLLRLESELSRLESNYTKWESFEVFDLLKQITLELYEAFGIEIESRGEAGLFVNIPFSEATVPSVVEQLEFLAQRSAEA